MTKEQMTQKSDYSGKITCIYQKTQNKQTLI